MPVAVMGLGDVRVIMGQGQVPMQVSVRFTYEFLSAVLVPVVILMPMGVVVLQFLMGMLMRMMFPQEEEDPSCHEHCCDTRLSSPGLS